MNKLIKLTSAVVLGCSSRCGANAMDQMSPEQMQAHIRGLYDVIADITQKNDAMWADYVHSQL